jgi:hypothetical protein
MAAQLQEPDMLPQLLAKTTGIPREKLLWPVLAVLVTGQLLAFWMLCIHQVRKAEVRNATLQVQRVAVADCLRYIPHATLNSCAARVDPGSRPHSGNVMAATDQQNRPAVGAATPGSYSNREKDALPADSGGLPGRRFVWGDDAVPAGRLQMRRAGVRQHAALRTD